MPSDPERSPSQQSFGVRALFWVWLGSQLLVPALQLLRERPAPFGWQMYSSELRSFELHVALPDGVMHAIDLDAYVTVPREEIPWQEILPTEICHGLPPGTLITASNGRSSTETLCE